MSAPLVSVVIPTYNQQRLLSQTLDSVFAQTCTDYEVVVVNDGSTDGTSAYLSSLGDRVRVIEQENRGIGAARNRGIEEARGKYVALLDHDDLWLPGKLAAQVAFMEAHPSCAACSVPWSRSGQPERCVFDQARVSPCGGVVDRPLWQLARGELFLISSSILFERRRAAGLRYELKRDCIEDTPFQIGLFCRGEFGIAGEEVLMVYRTHAANYSSQGKFFFNGIRLLRGLERGGAFQDLPAHWQPDLSNFLAHLGRTAAVRQLMGGYRLGGLRLFLSEFRPQLRLAKFKFLLAFPLLMLLPKKLLRLRWQGEVR